MSRIGETEIDVSMGTRIHSLRPSLRCATRLARRYNGFEPLAKAIADGTLHVMADVIFEGARDDFNNRGEVEAALLHNISQLDQITPQLLAFIFTLCGMDADAPLEAAESTTKPGTSKPESFVDFYGRLFRIATGWLGWTPQEAWNATPTEIIEAYKGRTELLQAIFGTSSSESEPKGEQKPDLDAKLDIEGLNDLRGLGAL